MWLALAGWTAELAALLLRKYVGQSMRLVYPAATLLGPVTYLVLFLAATLALLAMRRLAGRWLRARFEVGVLTTLCALAVVAVFAGTLGRLPWLLLSLGIGVQSMRLITSKPTGFQRLISWSTIPLLAIAVIAGPGWYVWTLAKERTGLVGLPTARAGAPNIVMIILDTVRSASMSLYGYGRPTTPFLESWAQRGVKFDRAIATAPWTVPSHAALFSGLLPTEMATEFNQPAKVGDQTLLAEALREQGYQTAGFVANVFYLSREFGLDRGFIRYEDHTLGLGQFVLSSSLGRTITNSKGFRRRSGYQAVLGFKSAETINRDFIDWLGRRKGQRPFFAFLNYYDAHEPYLPPEPFRTRFALPGPVPTYWYDGHRAERDSMRDLSREEIQTQTGSYDGTIAYLDHAMEQLFAALARAGELDNTLVIVTSDHGEEFGEHEVMGHARTVYLPAIHVPLLIAYPGRVPSGVTVTKPVSLRDMPATVLDLAGLPGRERFPGASLARHWQHADSSSFDLIFSAILARGKPRSLLWNNYHYVRRENFEELYDISRDPLEQKDLANATTSQALLNAFSWKMTAVPSLDLHRIPRSRSGNNAAKAQKPR